MRIPLRKRPNDLRAVLIAFGIIVALMVILWLFGKPDYV